MKLFNTNTRSIEEITPLHNNTIGFYACGPTVYATPQIGNWVAYIRWDALARTLRQSFDLNWYINITDVGHLVSDADDGEDKLEKGARREGLTAWEVAKTYTQEFVDGLDALNISIDRSHLVKATDNIDEQIQLITALEQKGYTYIIDDGVYFDSTKFADYGKMARLDIEGLQAGARVDVGEKKHSTDFALWKFTPKGQRRDMEWDSPWGKGFPGWHIECSAMAMKYLGETLDIHAGGIDHIPVHHTNEIAQSEAATGKPFVKTWVHSNFMLVDGQKISKSLQNGFTLADLVEKGFDALDLRMLVLQSHFQTESNFTWEVLEAARTRRKELQAAADQRFQLRTGETSEVVDFTDIGKQVQAVLDNNLNTPQALALVSSLVNAVDKHGVSRTQAPEFSELLQLLDDLLGFNVLASKDITDQQQKIIQEREAARDAKDWATSDALRDTLQAEGIGLNDTVHGTVWHRL